MDRNNDKHWIDISLLYLLEGENEDSVEFALSDLIDRYKNKVLNTLKQQQNYSYRSRSQGLLILSQLIQTYKFNHSDPLYLYIERELPNKIYNGFRKHSTDYQEKLLSHIDNEIALIKKVYPEAQEFDIAKVLQIPLENESNLNAQGERYGFLPLSRQINNIQWLVLYNLDQDDPDASYSRLNHNLGLSIGHLEKTWWWTKYKILSIINEL